MTKERPVKLPTSQTLRKYGLSMNEWIELWDRQGGVCPICEKLMTRPVIDHFHIKGWKKMPPEQRKLYVRQLLCWVDNNRILTRGVTVDKLERAAKYLREWEQKRPPE